MPAKKPAQGPRKAGKSDPSAVKESTAEYPAWTGGLIDHDARIFLLMMDITQKGSAKVSKLSEHYQWLFAATRELEGQLLGYFLTMGPHDIVAVVTLPNDECAFDLAAQLTEHGWVTTTTMRAFSLDSLLATGHH